MCGKFTAMMIWREYCDLADVSLSGGYAGPDAMDADTVLGTMTPMATVPVLHLGPVRQRRITAMRWGWPDMRAADPSRGFRHLHARSEEIDRTPTWIEPFHEARGVVFTKSFNIGETLPSGKTKQWVCSRADGEPVAIAVIYSSWELPRRAPRVRHGDDRLVRAARCERRADARAPRHGRHRHLAWRDGRECGRTQSAAASLWTLAGDTRAGGT
jgi:putative SOS response-associated peptidase YedK